MLEVEPPRELEEIEFSNWKYVLHSCGDRSRLFLNVAVCQGAIDWSFNVELTKEEIAAYNLQGREYIEELYEELRGNPKQYNNSRGLIGFTEWPCYQSKKRLPRF